MGVYKIKDLENLSGVKAHTIRIWEKRYNILKPNRTDTQIREYTDAELTTLLNISLLNKHGIKISRIAEMSPNEMSSLLKKKEIENFEDCFHENLLLALLDLNENLFKQTLEQLISEIGLELTYTKHLIPFLERIGLMWIVGSINPAQEHFISNLIRQKLISEIDKIEVNEESSEAVVLFLPEHETHELSLLFYDFLLKKNGLKTYYLGQMLPYESLILSIEKINPKAIVSSWISAVEEEYCISYFNRITKDSNIPVFAGGNIIKQLHAKLEGKINLIDSLDDLRNIYAS
jgi:DNA-binding transcriptional MerR regulator